MAQTYNPEAPHSQSFATTPSGLVPITSSTLTRPSDTTAYAANDLVANSTTAGSVAMTAIPNAVRANSEGFRIERLRLYKSGTSLTNASFRVYIFRTNTATFSAGDNAAFNSSGTLAMSTVADLVGWFDVTVDRAGTAMSMGVGVPNQGSSITAKPTSGTSLYFVVEATAAYTPVSAETFSVVLEGQWA